MPSNNCHKCHRDWEAGGKPRPGFKETCLNCGAYLHSCKNCRFHRPSMHNQCYIPNTEWVGDRAGANFCEEFEFAMTDPAAGDGETAREAAKPSFEALFGNNSEAGQAPPPSGFDDLFKD